MLIVLVQEILRPNVCRCCRLQGSLPRNKPSIKMENPQERSNHHTWVLHQIVYGLTSRSLHKPNTRYHVLEELVYNLTRLFISFYWKLLQFNLPEDARMLVKKISVIRNLSQKVTFCEVFLICSSAYVDILATRISLNLHFCSAISWEKVKS